MAHQGRFCARVYLIKLLLMKIGVSFQSKHYPVAKYNSLYPTSKGTKIESIAASSSASQSGFEALSSDDEEIVVTEDASALDSEKSSMTEKKEEEHSPLSKLKKVSKGSHDASRNIEPVAQSDNSKGKKTQQIK